MSCLVVFIAHLGMMLNNINEMDRVESALVKAIDKEAQFTTSQEVVQYALYGEPHNELDAVYQFTPEEEGVIEDDNGYSLDKYEQVISSAKTLLNELNEFEPPIYTGMIPTLTRYVADLEVKKNVEFPPEASNPPRQSTINDFLHYRE